MRTRILQYLERAAGPVPAEKILRDALQIHSPNAFTADKVLKAILSKDPRFRRESNGLWTILPTDSKKPVPGIENTASLFLQSTRAPSNQRHLRGAMHFARTGSVREFSLSGSMQSGERQVLRQARTEAEGQLLITWNSNEVRIWNWLLRNQALAVWDEPALKLQKLAQRIFPSLSGRFPCAELAPHLQIAPPDEEQPASMARFYSACFEQLLERVPEDSRSTWKAFDQWLNQTDQAVDFRWFAFGPDFLHRIPDTPGVYIMRSRSGDIIYVGKTGNLKRRVRSYFSPRALRDPKVARIHGQLHSLEFSPTRSEIDALLLEMRLIRDFQPPMNLQTEVHERPAAYGKTRNLILLVPDSDAEKAQTFFLQNGSFIGQQAVPLGRKPQKRLRERIRSTYFSGSRREVRRKEPWEMELVSSWLSSNRKRLNFVDVDEAGSYEAVLRLVTQYLMDPERLSRKVYYR